MKLVTLLLGIKIAAVFIALLMLLIKLIDGWRYKAKTNRPLKLRWIGWYSSVEVVGSSSPTRREIMQRSNITSTIIWACVAIIIGISILPEQ